MILIKLVFSMIWPILNIRIWTQLRTQLDKVLRDKAFNIAVNLKHDESKRRLAEMVFEIFDENSASLAKNSGIKSIPNEHPLNLAMQ